MPAFVRAFFARPETPGRIPAWQAESPLHDSDPPYDRNQMIPHRRPGRKAYLMVAGFALLLVLFPFLFWYSTWFGRPLSDGQIDEYFVDRAKPRHAQHALIQVGERILRGQNVSRWYSNVVAQASS